MENQKARLHQRLGFVHVFAIASGAMISSGLFVLPGLAHARAGPAVVISYLLAGMLAAIGTVSIAELTTAMPKAGGDYFFIMRSFGPAAGTVTGLLSWFSLALKSAFAIVGMMTFASMIVDFHGLTVGIFFCLIFVAINLFGVHQAARFQIFLVIGLYGLLLMYVAVCLPHFQMELLRPLVPHGWPMVFSATGFVFISYGGLLKVAGIAEEVKNPGRTIPLGMIVALVTAAAVYTAVILVTSGILPTAQLDGSLTPISDVGRIVLGRWGGMAMSLAAVLAFISTANAGIMSASRYLLALSRDELLPESFGAVHARFGTPYVAIMITGAFIIASLFLPLEVLVKAASTVLILTFIMSCLSVILLRESGIHNYRPKFQAPLYPWSQIAGIVAFVFLLFEMGWHAYLISAGLIVIGFLVYWFYGRRFVQQEFALMHIVEQLTDQKIVTGSLEKELKEIVRERDHIDLDRFDYLVEDAPVLDVKKHLALDDFFHLAAETLAPHLGIGPLELERILKKREQENSTCLNDSLAVPHVVIPGEKKFKLLLVRARKGITFSDKAPRVTTIFVITGTGDDRMFHLRVLAAIAQIFQSKNFEKRWMSATNKQGLRDVVVLSERRRGRKGNASGTLH